jgi:hypothetical protein
MSTKAVATVVIAVLTLSKSFKKVLRRFGGLPLV